MDKQQRYKATMLEHQRRISTVMGWIKDCTPSALIIAEILNLNWCKSERNAHRILAHARQRWRVIDETKLEEERDLKIVQLQETRRSLRKEYVGTPQGILAQLAVDKEINKIKGNYAPAKVEMTGKDGQPIKIETKNEATIDVTKLSTEVLEAIANARITNDKQ